MKTDYKDLKIDVFRQPIPPPREVTVKVTHIPTGQNATATGYLPEITLRKSAIKLLERKLKEIQ